MSLSPGQDDTALLVRWRSGDQRAGHDLFRRHFAEIHRFFQHKVGTDAEDLAQRTFLACLTSRDAFRTQSSFRTFLYAIARHELYGYLRRKQRDDCLDFAVTSLPAIATTPSSRIGRAQRAEELRAALSELPADTQLLLELHYWHDMDAAALAEVFAATAATIRVRLVRARRDLRARLGGAAIVAGDPLAAAIAAPELDA